MSFVRAPNPIWFMVDLTGLALNDQYYAFFLTNTLPYLPQPVYQDPQGMTVWNDPIQFYPNGTLPDNMYFDPNLVYRIEIRQGNSQLDPLIYEINNFVPEGSNSVITDLTLLNAENQISNPTFSQVNFTTPPMGALPTLTITTAGTYDIAPGWQLVLTGIGGSTTLTQLIYSADQNNPPTAANTPAYALKIANAGWTTAFLRQRFNNNGGIWVNGAVSMSMVAQAVGGNVLIAMTYAPQSPPGTAVPVVLPTVVQTGSYQKISGIVNVGPSTNSNLSNVSYVDMLITLPPNGTIDISDVQVVGQDNALPTPITISPPPFQEISEERMIDHLFHYYQHDLIVKPKKSLLVGWNFPLNPYQFVSTTVATQTAQTAYAADQTIVHQEAGSQIQTGQNTAANRGGFVVKAVTAAATTRFALIQYIDPSTIKPYWSYILSSLVRAKIITDAASQVGLKARLIWRTNLPSTIGNAEPIASWPANSDPVFAAGWTAIAPLNDPQYILQTGNDPNEVASENSYPSYAFEHFNIPDASTASMTLGIVIYTMNNLNSVAGHEDSVEFDKISLLPSSFAADADPMTFDQSLSECQYYYEMSYPVGTIAAPNPIVAGNEVSAEQYAFNDTNNSSLYLRGFSYRYNRIKRAIPSALIFYNPTIAGAGSIGFIRTELRSGAAGIANGSEAIVSWTLNNSNTKGFSYLSANTDTAKLTTADMGANKFPEGYILYHFTADSRLGV
jgi:hypothetical protein